MFDGGGAADIDPWQVATHKNIVIIVEERPSRLM